MICILHHIDHIMVEQRSLPRTHTQTQRQRETAIITGLDSIVFSRLSFNYSFKGNNSINKLIRNK